MLTLHHKPLVAAFAGLGLLIGAAFTPARADPGFSGGAGGISDNALTPTALVTNALITGGSALGDLNSVAVEAITLTQTPEY